MSSRLIKKVVPFALSVTLIFSTHIRANSQVRLPNPILVFIGAEQVERNGKQVTRYIFDVFNRGDYPAEMFAPAPGLPPCGANANASRTWVDLYDQSNKRLNGFCALEHPKNLSGIWFGLESESVPPSWIYIEMTDRQTNTKYKSNLAETTL